MNLDFRELENSSDYKLLKNLLIKVKEIAPSYYKNDNFDESYKYYISKLYEYREYMNIEYICDVSIVEHLVTKEDILDYIVSECRNWILYFREYKYKSINEIDLTNWCIMTSIHIKKFCEKLGITCGIYEIWPGYNKDSKLFKGTGFHYFNIVTIFNKRYLIDVTYKQFFKKNLCLFEEIGVPLMCAPLAGAFMMIDNERERVANKILKDGWIELTENVLKHYCDGFTLSFRNGLYYDCSLSNNYVTTYTNDDYINFLNGNDNQLNHEKLECLGPLKKCIKTN